MKRLNPNWPQIPDHLYRLLITEGSGYGKTNSLFNIISHQTDIDKIYLYAKDLYEAMYQLLITKREKPALRYCKNSKDFIQYSTDIDDIYENIEEYHLNKKHKILIIFDDMIADMLSNKKLNPIVTELYVMGRKLKYFFCFYKEYKN